MSGKQSYSLVTQTTWSLATRLVLLTECSNKLTHFRLDVEAERERPSFQQRNEVERLPFVSGGRLD